MLDRIIEILQGIRDDIDYYSEDSLIDDGLLDSFDIVSIVSEVNDRFDVAIPAKELVPENFNSAKALWDLITRLEED